MLTVENVSYKVKEDNKEKLILDDINFSIKKDEMLVITGHNGSGKSTLAKILMGILKPTTGKITFNGKDITNMSVCDRAKLGISYGFQQPIYFKGLTVKDLLNIACQNEVSVPCACKYLSQVGLCAKEYVFREVNNKLSGGELKRIEIATILAKNGSLNIYDEPEAGIDLWSFDALVKIFKKKTATNIIISHQQRLIELADKIILLNSAKIEKQGTKAEVLPYLHNDLCMRLKGEDYE